MYYDPMMVLAERKHQGQFRKTRPGETPVPYFEHPRNVVKNLLDWGEPENSPAIGIAWGHDLMEDTDVTDREILEASDENVLQGIRKLTYRKGTDKQQYLRNVASSGNRNVLLVKISDRIHNSRDFIRYSGRVRAYEYLHEADCIRAAVQALPADPVLKNALAAWQELDQSLQKRN